MLTTSLLVFLAPGLFALWWFTRAAKQRKLADSARLNQSQHDRIMERQAQRQAELERQSALRLELQSQLRVRESVIKRLMHSAGQADLAHEWQAGELTMGTRRLTALDVEIRDKDQRISTLKNRVTHLESLAAVNFERIDELTPVARQAQQTSAALQEKEVRIKQLEQTAANSTSAISDLQTKLRAKDRETDQEVEHEIAQLTQQAQQVPVLETILRKRDAQIAQLDQSVLALEKAIADSAAQIATLESNADAAASLHREIESQADAAASLKADLDAQADHVAGLEAELREIDQRQEAMQAREAQLGDIQSRLDGLSAMRQALDEREATIAEQNGELQRLAAVEAAAAEKDEELAKLKEASARLQANHAKAESIRKALNKAEHVAIAAQQGALQAQRLREELENLGRDKINLPTSADADTNDMTAEPERDDPEVLESAQALLARISELELLEADIQSRDKKVADLKKRLATLSRAKKTATKARKSRKSSKPQITGPLYDAPSERDDLKKIHGIGPVLEKNLNELGVTTYRQLAGFQNDDITKVTEALGIIPNRVERDDWIGGARKALSGVNGQSESRA